MERFTSTLGTTATIVLGLVLAAHLRNGGYEEPQAPRPAAATVTTWTDPPTGLPHARAASTETLTFSPDGASLMPGSVAAILPAGLSAPIQLRTAAAGRTFWTARHTAGVREAPVRGGGDVAAAARGSSAGQVAEPDEIGALIRDLDAERRS